MVNNMRTSVLVCCIAMVALPLMVAAKKEKSNITYTVTDEAWFELQVKGMDGPGQDYKGRVVIALFGDIVPMTVMNFVQLTKGYKRSGEMLSYNNTKVHRIVPDFVMQMGDVTTGDGTGGKSIYGPTFVDENFRLSHRAPGWVAMANYGSDTNGSQFYILLSRARWLDGKHVVFGKVIRGMDVLHTIAENVGTDNTAVPETDVRIVASGMNQIDMKYQLPDSLLDSQDDI